MASKSAQMQVLEQPNPVPTLKVDQPLFKNALCPFYGECLDRAVREKWIQFSCSSCRYQKTMIEIRPTEAEMIGYYRLLYELFGRELDRRKRYRSNQTSYQSRAVA